MEGQLPNSPSSVPPLAATPPTPPPPPVAPAAPVVKKGTSSVLLAILGVVMVGGIAFAALTLWQKGLLGGFLAKPTPTPTLAPEPTPTPNPTANWKTYTDKDALFSLKYPSDWFTDTGMATKTFCSLETTDPTNVSQDQICVQIWLEGSVDPKRPIKMPATLQEFVNQKFGKDTTGKGDYETVAFEKMTIQEAEAAKFSARGSLYYVIHRENTFYTIAVSPANSVQMNTLELMLATFEFLTPTPTGTQTKGGITQGTPVKIKSIYLASSTEGPLVIKGTVDPGWMFEGVMPVKLLDSSRQEIASGSAKETTPGSWQSGKAVAFSVELTFTTQSASGFLVFQNDNPSGLPENQKSFELPVKFRQ